MYINYIQGNTKKTFLTKLAIPQDSFLKKHNNLIIPALIVIFLYTT